MTSKIITALSVLTVAVQVEQPPFEPDTELAPTLVLDLIVTSAHMNIPNEVKRWHKSAPMLITAVTILGLIVLLHH